MKKGFADFLSHKVPGLRPTCKKAELLIGQVFPFWDSTGRRYIDNLVTKERFHDKPDLPTLLTTLEKNEVPRRNARRFNNHHPKDRLRIGPDELARSGKAAA